jgi:hypothetical protein
MSFRLLLKQIAQIRYFHFLKILWRHEFRRIDWILLD